MHSGTTRMVWLVGRWAIKLPAFESWNNFLRGLLANRQERIFAPLDRQKLCPIVFSIPGGWLVVMRRARPLTDREWETFDPDGFCITENYILPAESKRDSFGVLDGRIVAVDFG